MQNTHQTKRIAVAVIFFVCGFITACWLSRLPEIQQYFGMSNALLGKLLLFFSLGSLIAMPFTGILAVRYGSKNITKWAALTTCFLVSLIPVFPTANMLMPFFLTWGVLAGSLDVAMNGQAVMVEKLYGRSIMSSFHAIFSIGTAIGAAVGTVFADHQISFSTHFFIATCFCLVITIWAVRHLVEDEKKIVHKAGEKQSAGFRLPTRAILPLGIIAFCGMSGESCLLDWSAIYMHKVVGKDVAFSALALTAFTTAMTIGRFLGDFLTMKFGKRRLLIFNAVTAIFGLSFSIIFINPFAVLIGFSIVGLSLSSIVPIIYSTAGNTPGVLPSVGISMASTIGYAGFFISPPLIGFLGDAINLRWGLAYTIILFFVMLILVFFYKFDDVALKVN